MNYKVEGAIKKTRKYFIIYAILWLFFVIVFIMPVGTAVVEATVNGKFAMSTFLDRFMYYLMKPFSSFGKSFLPAYISSFIGILWKFTFAYLILCIVLLFGSNHLNHFLFLNIHF